MSDAETAWQSWLSGLTPSKRAAAETLRTRFEALGATDAPTWVTSAIDEAQPHLARFLLLRSLWDVAIDSWGTPGALEQIPAARRLLAAGADRDDLLLLARAAAYESVFATVDTLDTGPDTDVPGIDTGWLLMESTDDGSPTGRTLDGLHEDLLTTDPSGRDGADLWQ
ncbi:hypothetical protein ABT095_21545 [Kitasatospora sp. NPDC002227]|uniref:hypothetical protein n=1 Tax=Kitasatospora sp. NPDC002227 TaxID=3154773 RepID=UPI003323F6F1